MSNRLNGITALVTGAGRGIGRSVAEIFAAEGAAVWATSRSAEPLKALAERKNIRMQALDVTRPSDVKRAAEAAEGVDVLVNCAGVVPGGSILDCAEVELEQALAVNVIGAFRMIQAFLPAMLERGSGTIINIASVLSSISSAPGRFAYGTSKAALIGMTKSVAADYAGRGIRCNAVCPGAVDTPGLRSRIASAPDPEATRGAFVARHPVGRLGEPEEIAEICVYLASAQGGFVTGQAIVIDGGMTL
jgi:2-keto-3-deoxy-L-fuconate dehydrogenase